MLELRTSLVERGFVHVVNKESPECLLVDGGPAHGETWWTRKCFRAAHSGVEDEHKQLGGLLVDGGLVHGKTLVGKACLRAGGLAAQCARYTGARYRAR